jgi:hypothetical protein
VTRRTLYLGFFGEEYRRLAKKTKKIKPTRFRDLIYKDYNTR